MSAAIQYSRKFFPRGLDQPADGFRFGVDSLLLASFAAQGDRTRAAKGLDLGCGCGVVSFGLLLSSNDRKLQILGLDIDPEMLRCASANAKKMGFDSQFSAILLDITKYDCINRSFDFVLTNPPYRPLGQGRESPRPKRTRACFETSADLPAFVRLAAKALKPGGAFLCVQTPQRLLGLLAALAEHRLAARRLRLVHGQVHGQAKILLLEARLRGRSGLVVEPPLVLQQGSRLTAQALEFCPFLACNPQRAGRGCQAPDAC